MLSLTSMNTAILLQPVQVSINLIFIPICIIYYDAELQKDPSVLFYGDRAQEFLTSLWNGGNRSELVEAGVLMGLGVLSIIICFISPRCRVMRNKERPASEKQGTRNLYFQTT